MRFFLQFSSKRTLSEILVEADGFILKIARVTYEFFFVRCLDSQQNHQMQTFSYNLQDKIKMKTSASTKLSGSVSWVQNSKKNGSQHLVHS